MKMMIYKYTLRPLQRSAFEVPKGARFIAAGEQEGFLVVWADFPVNDEGQPGETELRTLFSAGTGLPFENRASDFTRAYPPTHIGTVQMDGYVWHVYEDRIP